MVWTSGPAVVIAGKCDSLVPIEHAHAYARGLRNAELRVIPDSGNSVAVERPDEVATAVLSCVHRARAAAAVA